MQKLKSLFYMPFVLALLFFAGSALVLSPSTASAAPLVIPKQQAAHFCRLLVSDESSVSTLSFRARQMIQLTEQRAPSELARRWSSRDGRKRSQPDDSLSVEQIFAGYILLADGWQTMRLFPHQEAGVVSWYSATDDMPASISSEHRKYIREVFPRLIAEVHAGNWETVDAYIDRMIQYQCQFGGSKLPPQPSSFTIIGIVLLYFAFLILQPRCKSLAVPLRSNFI